MNRPLTPQGDYHEKTIRENRKGNRKGQRKKLLDNFINNYFSMCYIPKYIYGNTITIDNFDILFLKERRNIYELRNERKEICCGY